MPAAFHPDHLFIRCAQVVVDLFHAVFDYVIVIVRVDQQNRHVDLRQGCMHLLDQEFQFHGGTDRIHRVGYMLGVSGRVEPAAAGLLAFGHVGFEPAQEAGHP